MGNGNKWETLSISYCDDNCPNNLLLLVHGSMVLHFFSFSLFHIYFSVLCSFSFISFFLSPLPFSMFGHSFLLLVTAALVSFSEKKAHRGV